MRQRLLLINGGKGDMTGLVFQAFPLKKQQQKKKKKRSFKNLAIGEFWGFTQETVTRFAKVPKTFLRFTEITAKSAIHFF